MKRVGRHFLLHSSSSEKVFHWFFALSIQRHVTRLSWFVYFYLKSVAVNRYAPTHKRWSCCYHNKLAYIILPYFNLTVTQSLLYTALTTTFNRVGKTEIHPQITGELHQPNWENFHNLSFVNGPLVRR